MKLPINLAYERSISPSDVVFLVNWPGGIQKPLPYTTRVVLGMKEGSAAYSSDGKTASGYALAQGNPHEIDYCCVPYNAQSIECRFSVSFSSELRRPYKCSEPGVKSTLTQLIELYEQRIGWDELANRFLINICNGSWLWKNKNHAYSTSIEITPWPWESDSVLFEDLRNNYCSNEDFEQHVHWPALLQLIMDAFSQPNGLCILEVKATLRFATNAPIYPSQVFKESVKREKNRVFQTTQIESNETPIIGCYKAGAAIFSIDDWYPKAEEALRVNHYGVHKHDLHCYRHPDTGKDFFTLLKNVDEYVELLANPDEISTETIKDIHFVISNLIKGGLFQQKGN